MIHGPSTNAPSGAATNCTVGKLYSKKWLLKLPSSGDCVFGVGAAGGSDCQLGINACWHMGHPTINTPTITRTTTTSVTATTATTSAVASTVKHGKNGSNHSDWHKGHNHGAGLCHRNNRRYAKSWWQYWQR